MERNDDYYGYTPVSIYQGRNFIMKNIIIAVGAIVASLILFFAILEEAHAALI